MLRHCLVPDTANLERELKYVLSGARMPFAERWLGALCRADVHYGCSDVWTVYYDTPDRASLGEKINSDYLKTKMRVRWYAPPGQPPAGDAYLEIKRRIGDRRDKRRVVLPDAAAALSRQPLDDGRWRHLPGQLAPSGTTLAGVWQPMLMLVYRRVRFVDALSGARVSCDRAIRAVALPRQVLAAWRADPLPVGVIEIKGRSEELPPTLRSIVRLGARQSSFSKYAAVWMHAQPR